MPCKCGVDRGRLPIVISGWWAGQPATSFRSIRPVRIGVPGGRYDSRGRDSKVAGFLARHRATGMLRRVPLSVIWLFSSSFIKSHQSATVFANYG